MHKTIFINPNSDDKVIDFILSQIKFSPFTEFLLKILNNYYYKFNDTNSIDLKKLLLIIEIKHNNSNQQINSLNTLFYSQKNLKLFHLNTTDLSNILKKITTVETLLKNKNSVKIDTIKPDNVTSNTLYALYKIIKNSTNNSSQEIKISQNIISYITINLINQNLKTDNQNLSKILNEHGIAPIRITINEENITSIESNYTKINLGNIDQQYNEIFLKN